MKISAASCFIACFVALIFACSQPLQALALPQAKPATPKAGSPAVKNINPAVVDLKWQKQVESADAASLFLGKQAAEEKYKAVLLFAENSKNDQAIIQSLYLLANCFEEQDRYEDALALRKRALSLAESCYGPESASYAQQLAGMSSYCAKKGEVQESRSLSEQSMGILGNNETKYPLEMAACYLAIGRRQISEQSFGLADDSFKKALELEQAKLGDKSYVVLKTCLEYANLLEKLGRKQDAALLHERISLAKALSVEPTTKAISSGATTFDKLVAEAKNAETQGNQEQALINWKLARQEAEKSTAKKGQLAYVLVHLGDKYMANKETAEAKAVFKKSLEEREKLPANDTLGMARNLQRLSNIYLQEKNYQDAENCLSRALEIEDKAGASELAVSQTLQSLASVCMLTKNNSKAEASCKRLISLSSQSDGPSAKMKKSMATSILAGIYMQTGRMSEGMQLIKTVSGLMTAQATSDYAKTSQSDYLLVDKEFEEAEQGAFVK